MIFRYDFVLEKIIESQIMIKAQKPLTVLNTFFMIRTHIMNHIMKFYVLIRVYPSN